MRAQAQDIADGLLMDRPGGAYWVRPAGHAAVSPVKAFLSCYETLTIGRFSAWVVLMGRPGPGATALADRLDVKACTLQPTRCCPPQHQHTPTPTPTHHDARWCCAGHHPQERADRPAVG